MSDIRTTELIETVVGLPPPGWTLGHVTIDLRSGKHPIEALRRGAFAVHEVDAFTGRAWRLSHAPTGTKIWTFYSMQDAVELAERIEPFTAWSEITKVMPSSTELYPKVRDVAVEIEERDRH